MFEDEKVHFLVYSEQLNERARDYRKPKVLFMAGREDKLIEYVRSYLKQTKITAPVASEPNPSGDSLKQIAQKLEDFLASKRTK